MTSETTELIIPSVLVATMDNESMHLPASIGTEDLRTIKMNALINSGAGEVFIDEDFMKKHTLETMALSKPIKVTNVDGTPNKEGTITEATTLWLKVDDKKI